MSAYPFRNALILGAALAGLHAATASAATPVTVVLGYVPDVESFGAYYAKAKGYFAEAGLDVTLIPAGTGIDQVQMVDSGQATIGIGGPDISLIIAGKIDCMITTFAFNEPALIEQAGVPVNVLRLGDYGLNAQTDSYFVKGDWYADAANQATLVKYMKAEGKAWDEFFKDPAGLSKWFV